MLIDATDKTFNTAIGTDGPVLLVFKASWCGPCKALMPVLEKLAKEHPTARIVRVDEAQGKKAMDAYGVRAFPTVYLLRLKDGNIESQKTVERTEERLRRALATGR